MKNVKENCPMHLQSADVLDEVDQVWARILDDGSILVIVQRTVKIRCCDCAGIELVKNAPQNFTVENFPVNLDGLRAIARKHPELHP